MIESCVPDRQTQEAITPDYRIEVSSWLPEGILQGYSGQPGESALKRGQRPVQIRTLEGIAPNINGSPSMSGWFANAILAARGNGTSGTSGTPAYFEDIQNVSSEAFIASDFFSWKGARDPAATLGSAFAAEKGNRVHLIARIVDPSGGKIDIEEGLSVFVSPNFFIPNGLSLGPIDRYFGYPFLFGVDYGPDRRAGSSDDLLLTSQTGPADEIYMVLLGFGVSVHSQGGNPLLEQQALDQAINLIDQEGFFKVETTFTFRGKSATSGINVNPGR